MANKFINYIITMVIICLILTFCSDSPFSEDKMEYTDGLSIRGKIELDDDSSPDQIYVWLKELNTGVFTDEQGKFILFLPSAEAQPGGGYTGQANVYFYLGNYQLEKRTVFLLDGKFQLNEQNIDSKGRLTNDILLKKILSIRTTVEPGILSSETCSKLALKTYISPLIDSVIIQTFKFQRDENMFTNVYFHDKNKPLEEAIFIRRSALLRTYAVSSNEEWYLNIYSDSLNLTDGIYDVVPYIKIIQNNFPFEMLNSLGVNTHSYDTSYLNIPFKEDTGQLRVIINTN